jgi:glycosyltransferase involved in cell wall biosynthesis
MPDRESLGGPAACEPPFVEGLRRLGVEVEEETYVYGDKLARTTVWQRVVRVVRVARSLRRRLLSSSFDVLHLNTSFDTKALIRDVVTLLLLPRRRAKIFLKFHGSDARLLETGNPALSLFARVLLKRADAVGLLSTEEQENFTRAGMERQKIFVVKNVLEFEEDDAERDVRDDGREARQVSKLASQLNVAEETPLLLFVARFIPAKGLTDCVRACAILRERGFDFRLLCVGDGPARAEAEQEVARLKLEGQVRFFGYVPEAKTREFYSGSTILLFPTYHYEGFPMVVFKSLAAGLPVVTTRIRAAADYLREPDNCLWVEPRNPPMLAEKIARLLEDPTLRASMSANNRTLARSFDAETVSREYLEAYRQLLEGTASRAPSPEA